MKIRAVCNKCYSENSKGKYYVYEEKDTAEMIEVAKNVINIWCPKCGVGFDLIFEPQGILDKLGAEM